MADIEELKPADIDIIQDKSEQFVKLIEESLNVCLTYDSEGVEKLSVLIEDLRDTGHIEQLDYLIEPGGYFLGETILRNAGGRWVFCDQVLAIQLATGGTTFPPDKVAKQFKNGLEDNIFGLYRDCLNTGKQS